MAVVSETTELHAGKGNRDGLVKREPPMPLVEFRNRSVVEECQPVKVRHHVRDFIVMSVDLTDPVHRPNLWKTGRRAAFLSSRGEAGVAGPDGRKPETEARIGDEGENAARTLPGVRRSFAKNRAGFDRTLKR